MYIAHGDGSLSPSCEADGVELWPIASTLNARYLQILESGILFYNRSRI